MRKHPNLFKDLILTRPEQAFVSDITYIKSRERTHCFSLVTDAHSRKIIGYHLSDDMSAENVVKALKMAFKERQSTQPLIHHSDRGLQYCSSLYQQELNKYDVLPSMTDGYDCYQNALAERINGILKQEFLTETCNTGQELELLIKESMAVNLCMTGKSTRIVAQELDIRPELIRRWKREHEQYSKRIFFRSR